MDTPRRALNGGNAPRAPCQPHVHQGVRADTNKPMSWQTSSRGRRLGTPKTNRKAQRALSGVVPVGAGRCRYLTRPSPGRSLLALSRRLTSITSVDQASAWLTMLHDFGHTFREWMSQRTFAAQDPAWASKTGKTWWYTHERTRRAYRRLARLARQGVLFTYLTNPDGTPADPPACATTNHVESINAVVRELLHAHRGASAYHQAVIAQWALLLRTPQPPTPTEVLTQWEHDGRPTPRRIPTPKHPNHTDQKRHGIPEGTPTPEEGLWPRKGWAGRAH